MKAIVYDQHGPPEVLQLRDLPDPEVAEGEVLIQVRAASINPLDWFAMTGTPLIARPGFGLKKPRAARLGADLAGVVDTVGAGVTTLKPGDEVFGTAKGTIAGLVVAAEGRSVVPKPGNLSFEEAAAVPVAALTALQALRDHANVQPGQQVLINGAAGGVGTFTVQIAKALDTSVTAVCSSRNVDLVHSLGADKVIDYTRVDFTKDVGRFDVLIDVAGSRRWSEVKRVLRPAAKVVIVGGPKTNRTFGPLGHMLQMTAGSAFASQKTTFFISKENVADMTLLRELIEGGKIKPFVEEVYPLERVAEALAYLGTGHARGKLVIAI
jgi:NADPH:quinone reductase-like Zn-dependent oxidoreductase